MLEAVLVAILAQYVPAGSANTMNASARPLAIPPSRQWDGNDGRWSSFLVRIGTPGQNVRLLPGTSATAGDTIWAVLPEGCTAANPGLNYTVCSNGRGGLFSRNESTSWSTSRLGNGGLYTLNTYEEAQLGLTGNAYYGFDDVSLGPEDDGMPTLPSQIIAGIATNDFWMGSLGLSPLPMNFLTLSDPYPSLLTSTRQSGLISSTTWAYTAGAYYRETFGSLTFGGYDADRFNASSNRLSVPFYTDQSRDLQVALQSITYDTLGSAPLLTEGIYTFIDSMVSHLWLPTAICQAFEQAFGLVWNETAELYLLNSTQHSALRAQSPSITFNLGSTLSSTGTNTTSITLPYSAFDLNISAPYTAAGENQPYFPLKRADNSSQYTLGRLFLQEAYLVADYDRKNFTLAQAAFPTTSALVGILPVGFTETKRASGGLSKGAIAGIAVAGAVAMIVALFVSYSLLRRKRRTEQETGRAGVFEQDVKQAMDVKVMSEDDSGHHELPGRYDHELMGSTAYAREMSGVTRHQIPAELAGGRSAHVSHEPSELPAGEVAPREIDSAAESSPFLPIAGQSSRPI